MSKVSILYPYRGNGRFAGAPLATPPRGGDNTESTDSSAGTIPAGAAIDVPY